MGTDFSEATLRMSAFADVDARNTTWNHAELARTRFINTDLRGADFSTAAFTRKIMVEDFHRCRMDATTKAPQGLPP